MTEQALVREQLFIGGQFVDGRDGGRVDVVEAASEEVIGSVILGGRADVDAAVRAARTAASGSWPTLTPAERQPLLHRFADYLSGQADSTARLVSRQNGMPLALSTGANGHFPALLVRYYADLAAAQAPDIRSGMRRTSTLVLRHPLGVVGAITPWNYPQALAAMKLAPALAAGCTVVLKPPPETALDCYAFAEAARHAGLPDGVVNIVPGSREAGSFLVSHPGIDKIAFTGSTAAGRQIASDCARLLRPVTLELGGKSAAILAEDVDLGLYLRALVRVSLPNAGQTCHSSTRILAPRSRYREIVDAVTSRVAALRVGDPLDPATDIGPLVSSAQRERVLSYIDEPGDSGARLTTGGRTAEIPDRGWFVAPTVFADVDNTTRVAQEEIFGPVLTITPYETDDDAVALANDSAYGLAGTVWTEDPERGISIARRVVTGTIGVNHYGLDPGAPFGGVKASGLGHELGPEGLRAYQRTQSIYLAASIPASAAHPANDAGRVPVARKESVS